MDYYGNSGDIYDWHGNPIEPDDDPADQPEAYEVDDRTQEDSLTETVQAFMLACGATDEDPLIPTRVSWLQSFMTEAIVRWDWSNDTDPSATREAITEIKALIHGLNAAIKKAKGGS